MSAVADDEIEPTIPEIAALALGKANGNVLKATEGMVKRVEGDARLYRMLMDPLVREACYSAVSMVVRKERRALWNAPQPSAAEAKARVEALAEGTARSLMEFQLPGGKYLRDATRGDVAAAAEDYAKRSLDMGAKAMWLRLIAQSLPEDKTVSEVMTDERLAELKVLAQTEIE